MRHPGTLLVYLIPYVLASIGDRLPQYRECLAQCYETQCVSHTPFLTEYDVNVFSKYLLLWTCPLDCDFKCRSHVAATRKSQGLPIVQFHGKWPFHRILGITEFFSTLFSLGNFWVNWINLINYHAIIQKVKASSRNKARIVMLNQYWVLLAVSVCGWLLSTIFHTRDVPVTETLDYLGAGAIIMANFNAISIRYFELFWVENQRKRICFQAGLLFVLCCHYIKLAHKWDYRYNMEYNCVIGLSALALWVLHSIRVHKLFGTPTHNTIQLQPYETKIRRKLRYLGKVRSRLIPLIPVFLNLFLTTSLSLELLDFAPIAGLLDSHSLWHLCTIFPPLIWYDWNLWDIEMVMATKLK